MTRARLLAALALWAGVPVSGHAETPLAERKSGAAFMSAEARAMQDDEAANPATLWLLDGESLWVRKAGRADVSCAQCHGDAARTMRGVAARYPAYDAAAGRPLNLEQRINACRVGAQQAAPFAYESRDLLALTAYVARQSRAMPIAPPDDPRLASFVERGRAAFVQRQGQLNIACAQCHDENWQRKLGGNPITQAHPTGYPLYRLEWQSLGSLQRRLRNCMAGVRAEAPPFGAPALVDLELYLMWRARGMPLEAPAVRP